MYGFDELCVYEGKSSRSDKCPSGSLCVDRYHYIKSAVGDPRLYGLQPGRTTSTISTSTTARHPIWPHSRKSSINLTLICCLPASLISPSWLFSLWCSPDYSTTETPKLKIPLGGKATASFAGVGWAVRKSVQIKAGDNQTMTYDDVTDCYLWSMHTRYHLSTGYCSWFLYTLLFSFN